MDQSKITKPLDGERLRILRDKATEAPFSGEHLYRNDKGEYRCGACGNVLFGSDDKFDSPCGWPSFSDVANSQSVELHKDTSYGMNRTEVVCANC